jgi:hypothetical protein
VIAVALLMASIGTPVRTQTRDLSVQEIAQLFASPSLAVRMEAASRTSELMEVGRSRELLGDANFQNALFDLLKTENADHVRRFQDEQFGLTIGEGWSMAYAGILGLAMDVVPLLTPTRQRDWFKELVRGSYNDDSQFGVWLAEYGDQIVDPLLDLTKTGAIIQQRRNAYALLTEMVGLTAFKPFASQPYPTSLSFANRQRALKAVDEGLHHQDDSVIRTIVRVLSGHASPETLTILEHFDGESRGQPSYARKSDSYLTLQEHVERAIAKVQTGLATNRR